MADTKRLARLVTAPLPLAYHPLYRFYEGGALTRAFRGLPERPDDWWSEDWVGSCTLGRARQTPGVLRTGHESREVRLLGDDALPFFDATALEVAGEIEVSDGRLCVAVVVSGDGTLEGDFGSHPVRRGETFALPASLPVRVRAGTEPVRIIRCLGPAMA